MNNKFVWCTFSKEGVHCYPAALTDPTLAEVSFLGYPHRHMFHVRIDVEVFHDDRDIEFILFKRELEGLYESGAMNLDAKSCEMISDELADYVLHKYPGRRIKISVSEDQENGSYAEY